MEYAYDVRGVETFRAKQKYTVWAHVSKNKTTIKM